MLKKSLLSLITIVSLISSNSIICNERKTEIPFSRKVAICTGAYLIIQGIGSFLGGCSLAMLPNIDKDNPIIYLNAWGGIISTLSGAFVLDWGMEAELYKKADLEKNKATAAQ